MEISFGIALFRVGDSAIEIPYVVSDEKERDVRALRNFGKKYGMEYLGLAEDVSQTTH